MSSDWYAQRDDRSMRYAGRVLDRARWIVVRARSPFAETYAGQVSLLTAVNLLGRMTPSIGVDVPDVPIAAPLPAAGSSLRNQLAKVLLGADPACRLHSHAPSAGDYVLSVGPEPAAHVVHGTGWNLFAGSGASPLDADEQANPCGPALAAIVGVSQLFVREMQPPDRVFLANTWDWNERVVGTNAPALPPLLGLGRVWSAGVGSVGTAILYFLTLATRDFSSVLFDMDDVKVHNLDRSPIFEDADVGTKKVGATARYLRTVGVADVVPDDAALDESRLWRDREPGSPDVLVSAANERDVRELIEGLYPPTQIYGTTGKNWQATMLRHQPMMDPCSCCVFPPRSQPTDCARGRVETHSGLEVDAALPFLSFAAGAMAATEILKSRFAESRDNRVVLNTSPRPRLVRAPLAHRVGCACQSRSVEIYREILASGTRR